MLKRFSADLLDRTKYLENDLDELVGLPTQQTHETLRFSVVPGLFPVLLVFFCNAGEAEEKHVELHNCFNSLLMLSSNQFIENVIMRAPIYPLDVGRYRKHCKHKTIT